MGRWRVATPSTSAWTILAAVVFIVSTVSLTAVAATEQGGVGRHLTSPAPLAPSQIDDSPPTLEDLSELVATADCFVENQGQVREGVRYYHIGSPSIALTDEGVLILLEGEEAGYAVLARFEDANPGAPIGLGPSCYESNFFVGEEARWRMGVPSYSAVRYEDLYDGVDLIYRWEVGLKADFFLDPGIDPGVIRFQYEGAGTPTIDGDGNLILSTAAGDVVDLAPYGYQGKEADRKDVAVSYRKNGEGMGFSVGSYDPTKPLVIDPLIYGTYLGGSDSDSNWHLAVDTEGNVYVTGETRSPDFPATPGAFDTTVNGGYDVMIAKLNPNGTALVYATYIGGGGLDAGRGIAVDATGIVYLTGKTASGNFPTTPGAFDETFNGLDDAFVLKLSSVGNELLYSTYLGGFFDESGFDIAIDNVGNAIVTGSTRSEDFPTTPGAVDESFNGDRDAFAVKLTADGTAVLWATYLGGMQYDYGEGLALDFSGNIYINGGTGSTDFPTTPGALSETFKGTGDAYIVKLSPDGTTLLYATYLGGRGKDEGFGIAVDVEGHAYVGGVTWSNDFPTTLGAYDSSYNGGGDVYVAKLNPEGTALLYGTFLGGTDWDDGRGPAIDAWGNAYMTGFTFSHDFPTTPPEALSIGLRGPWDSFLAQISSDGSRLVYSTYLGGSDRDVSFAGIAVDALRNVYATGTTRSSDFPTTEGAFATTLSSAVDVYVVKLNFDDPPESQALTVDSFSPDSPGIMHVLSEAPEFAWTYSDPEGDLQTDYEVRLGTSSGSADMWSPGPAGRPGSRANYTGPPLADGSDHWFAVRVSDGLQWSPWNETTFHTNEPLPAPTPNFPEDGTIGVPPGNVTLSWEAVTDIESDSATYYWYLSMSPDLAVLVDSGRSAVNSTIVPVLSETQYYWRVQAWDGWEFGRNSSASHFATASATPVASLPPWWFVVPLLVGTAVFVILYLVWRRRGGGVAGGQGGTERSL